MKYLLNFGIQNSARIMLSKLQSTVEGILYISNAFVHYCVMNVWTDRQTKKFKYITFMWGLLTTNLWLVFELYAHMLWLTLNGLFTCLM